MRKKGCMTPSFSEDLAKEEMFQVIISLYPILKWMQGNSWSLQTQMVI